MTTATLRRSATPVGTLRVGQLPGGYFHVRGYLAQAG
ncbi:hypothetical protein VG1_CDS0076, partial [Arthrobacter phage Cupello]